MIKAKYCILFLTFIIVLLTCVISIKQIEANLNNESYCIYIDAGHGGFDGGATSQDKLTIEKDICLNISLILGEYFKRSGIEVLYTRVKDEALGKNKKTDMYKRVDLINNSVCDIYVSIHANSYSASSVKGAQTFYNSKFIENKMLATSIMNYLKLLDASNKRVAKELSGKYLVDNAMKVGCLVEVGFLTNDIDLTNLKNSTYIHELALHIYMGILDYIEVRKAV